MNPPSSSIPPDPATDQPGKFAVDHQYDLPSTITTRFGAPATDVRNTLTVGPRGPTMMADTTAVEILSSALRERIPERFVHAKGTSAFGEFVVTRPEITKYCQAELFNTVDKKTPVVVRFSTVVGSRGSADTVRDLRGMAIKFYTENGNFDLVGINSPVFFIRDSLMFVDFVHALKGNQQTNVPNVNMRWDMITRRPESLYTIMRMNADVGIPDGFRYMDAWGGNTYRLVNGRGEVFYNKFYLRSNQGVRNLDNDTANRLAGTTPDYAITDLFNAIAQGDHPSWTLFVQIMTPEQAKGFEFNAFDLTKIWPEDRYPLIEVGRLTLTRNQTNFFAQSELAAYCPANLVPGIEFSPDKALNIRGFSYADAQRYRLGVQHYQIRVNQPDKGTFSPRMRDGPMNATENYGGTPNYWPNSFTPNISSTPAVSQHRVHIGETYAWRYSTEDEDNYTQPRAYFLSMSADERVRLCNNMGTDLSAAYDFIQKRALEHFEKIHAELAAGVRQAIERAIALAQAK